MAMLPHVQTLDQAPGIVASVERIDAWMEIANAGDRFVYATLLCLPVASAGAKRMRDLSDRGLVCLTRPRSMLDPTVFNYQAVRTSKASALTRPSRPRLAVSASPILDAEAALVDALLPVLERYARAGRPCPTDSQLAARAGFPRESVQAALGAMSAAHMIRVIAAPRPTLRRILILSTGHLTGIAA